ncbi:unnamed protein product [Adineta steineri]|uniref:DUF4371 domain-containing protein n=1 Tax=Adineta steineri TaxID=433720 RepID=A0A819T3Z5_9BILA|nr:unnamed protein product [Adineta steineri]CAF4066610.1 unnamed protein product [Adineta steineri]
MIDFSLVYRLLSKPWVLPKNYIFPKIEQNGKIRSPLRSLKDAIDYLSNLDKCDYHKFSVTQATECVNRCSHLNSDINLLLNDINQQQQNKNRLILDSIIKCILFLGKQNIAFRGNNDDGLTDYDNSSQGNFKSLLLFKADAGDQVLQKHMRYHAKNATYMGSNIQNELIGICVNFIQKYIVNELIDQNKFYAVIADETSDISGTERLSISIRFVSEENNISIKEIILGCVSLSDLSAVRITEAIITFIRKCGLDIKESVGPGYDGASVVAGKYGGVQKLMKDIAPRAVYIHCSNHSLDLVLAYACTLQIIKTFFGTIKSIVKLINSCPKRKSVLAIVIEATTSDTKRRHLVKLCEIRWVDKQTSIIVFKQVYFSVIVALEYLIENGDPETSDLALAYEKAINDIDFVIPLIVVNRVFCITKPYAEQLQKPTCDLVKCYQSIEEISIYLFKLLYHDAQLNELYNEFIKFIESNETNNCLTRTASRRYKTVKDYFADANERSSTINDTLKIIQPIKFFYPNIYILLELYALIPASVADAERVDNLLLAAVTSTSAVPILSNLLFCIAAASLVVPSHVFKIAKVSAMNRDFSKH